MSTNLVAVAGTGPIRLKSESSRNASNKASPRSRFFSLLMRELAGHDGDEMANALIDKDMDKFRKMMGDVTDNIVRNASNMTFK